VVIAEKFTLAEIILLLLPSTANLSSAKSVIVNRWCVPTLVIGRETSSGKINCLRINVLLLWKCKYSNHVTKLFKMNLIESKIFVNYLLS